MKKFENVYQDAALMKKALLGEANERNSKSLKSDWQNARTYKKCLSNYRMARH